MHAYAHFEPFRTNESILLTNALGVRMYFFSKPDNNNDNNY